MTTRKIMGTGYMDPFINRTHRSSTLKARRCIRMDVPLIFQWSFFKPLSTSTVEKLHPPCIFLVLVHSMWDMSHTVYSENHFETILILTASLASVNCNGVISRSYNEQHFSIPYATFLFPYSYTSTPKSCVLALIHEQVSEPRLIGNLNLGKSIFENVSSGV